MLAIYVLCFFKKNVIVLGKPTLVSSILLFSGENTGWYYTVKQQFCYSALAKWSALATE